MTHMDEHDHVVVAEDRGTGMGAILGVIVLLLLLAVAWWFAVGPGAGSTTNTNGGPAVTEPAAPSTEPQPSAGGSPQPSAS
jgi:hypothetical protein